MPKNKIDTYTPSVIAFRNDSLDTLSQAVQQKVMSAIPDKSRASLMKLEKQSTSLSLSLSHHFLKEVLCFLHARCERIGSPKMENKVGTVRTDSYVPGNTSQTDLSFITS
jgi:hypothetical protein